MGLFDKLKYNLAQKRFKREFRNMNRAGRVYNLDEARSLALLYYLDSEETLSIVKKYVKYLKEEEGLKKIMAIGYWSGNPKEVPAYISPKLEFDFLLHHEHAKNHKPTGNLVKNFIHEDFDVLIDLTFEKKLPLQYLLNWSVARFKVGVHNPEDLHCYDLTVIQQSKSLTDFIDNTTSILKKINKPHVA